MDHSASVEFRSFSPLDLPGLAEILRRIGWADRYVAGQMISIQAFAADPEDARVLVAVADVLVGFVTVKFEPWNRRRW